MAQDKIQRIPLLTAVLDPAKRTEHVEVRRIDFQPGQQTGIHQHPCPVVGYIASGSAIVQIEGGESRTVKAGEAFFEPANTTMLRFDNASDKEPMSFICFYLLDQGEDELIRML